jgi:membrane peptidoglycan carboxypeptidase
VASYRARRYLAYRRRKRNGNGHGVPKWAIALGLLGAVVAVLVGVVAGVGYGIYESYADDLIPPDEAIAKLPRGGARVLDRNGNFMYEFLDEGSGLRDPVPIGEISPYLVAATISAEDTSFEDNPGVNFKGLAAAAWDNFSPFSDTPGFLEGRGGSSITQQLVKNIYFTPEERSDRSISRKIKETVYALELTEKYEKSQIMEWYLNYISYGNVFVGAERASLGYFGKHANELTLSEAATLAAIPACPSCYDPISEPEATLNQRNLVLRRMYEEGYITEARHLWDASIQPLNVSLRDFPIQAPHFVFNQVQPELERLLGEEAVRRDGLVVYTSIDLDLQRKAEEILEKQIATYEYSGGHNGAVVAIDPKTAEVLVYVGSRDYFRTDISGQNDMAIALNSPGSAFKPFTYLTAFMNLGWGPGTEIIDSPIPAKYWDAERQPVNPTGRHHGPISARNALGNSLNVSAVKTVLFAGVPEVVEQARKMGITSIDDPTRYGPSLTVGGVDVKLIDMVYGYSVFPNLGILRGVEPTVKRAPGNRPLDPVIILRVEDSDGNVLYPIVDGQPAERAKPLEERVAPAAESFMISDILSDGNAQCITFRVCGALSMPGRKLAVKTGTSEPYENSRAIGDTWALGFTPELVVGSWFGNADNAPMTNISSTSVSWGAVKDFAIAFHEGKPVTDFQVPEGLVRAKACMPSGMKSGNSCPRATRDDWFAAAAKQDDWWTVARIDVRTGKLAAENTPPQFVREGRYLRLPNTLTEFQREQAQEWARIIGVSSGVAPTEQTQPSDITVSITSPAPAAQVSGELTITGRAASSAFQSYRLEVRAEAGGDDWVVIVDSPSPVEDGVLGTWDTSGQPGGLYTIRLVLNDGSLGEVITRVQVVVAEPGGAPPPEEQPPGNGGGGGRGRGGNQD